MIVILVYFNNYCAGVLLIFVLAHAVNKIDLSTQCFATDNMSHHTLSEVGHELMHAGCVSNCLSWHVCCSCAYVQFCVVLVKLIEMMPACKRKFLSGIQHLSRLVTMWSQDTIFQQAHVIVISKFLKRHF